MEALSGSLKIPDLWQQQAVQHLHKGKDVVVDAPTGAGKTYIFELFVQSGLKRQAVYTVPTRALANDKLMEWRARGWNVGIATGDVAERLDAPVVVATLETQKGKLIRGQGPGLLVIDEYQMLADHQRGINYELAMALAPVGTQLLMLSGSVSNPNRIVQWLNNIGREALLVSHKQRPVPLDEVHLEALPERLPPSVRGKWPRAIARALAADLGPVLVFAPQRKAAKALAHKLAAALPTPDWLELSSEQRQVAGDDMAKLLRHRIAYHHSGLSYPQRAGLIEPLAKNGQLRVIVATTGLAAGINFSMRTVLVTEREYQHAGQSFAVRPDELLQMFGRAGRRGLDSKGYILVTPQSPRLNEARPMLLRRSAKVDWPSFLAVMHQACEEQRNPVEAAEELACRLFTEKRITLGFNRLPRKAPSAQGSDVRPTATQLRKLREMLNSVSEWEREKPPVACTLGDTLVYLDKSWQPALQNPRTLEAVPCGSLCRLPGTRPRRYGRVVKLATLPEDEGQDKVTLVKWFYRALRNHHQEHSPEKPPPSRFWTIDELERRLLPLLPALTQGGQPTELEESNGTLQVRLDYQQARVFARVDSAGQRLLNPPTREVTAPDEPSFAEMAGSEAETARRTPAELWLQLGLIDHRRRPTRHRGIIFSFFNHGEGLAIAAALEDEAYPLDALLEDIANLRAGHRFSLLETGTSRLGALCRMTYRGVTVAGYLDHGLPLQYGEGAAEILQILRQQPERRNEFLADGNLGSGDLERAQLEWRSLLNHIAFAPDYDWDRWENFRAMAHARVAEEFAVPRIAVMPELTSAQRHKPAHLR